MSLDLVFFFSTPVGLVLTTKGHYIGIDRVSFSFSLVVLISPTIFGLRLEGSESFASS